ncbi:hypothetical protein HN371_30150 [Candidatus Poribacteria bacterium]|jgi:hypothetical protein|nr:hypothetical protein [Candidatus Poribacteria bacterium]MBT7805366.1 hypothetical protein [Candidatus Poribacteria bacterium]
MAEQLRATLPLAAFLLLCVGCDGLVPPPYDNCLDENSASYELPAAVITGRPELDFGTAEAEVTFAWRGGNDCVSEFSHRLNGETWTPWSSLSSVTLTALDEGTHAFEVRARYPTEVESSAPDRRTFTVDAVNGPALMIRPRQTRASVGDTFEVDVMAEEVEGLMLAHVMIEYDVSALRLSGPPQEASFVSQQGGVAIFLYREADGSIDISIGVATADPPGVSGSGAIATLGFQLLRQARSAISFGAATELRDASNLPIASTTFVPGSVSVASPNQ